MIHQLIPWPKLTRSGIPAMKVARRPLKVGEVTVLPGQTLDPELFPHNIRALRLRQFYEMRRLEPVEPERNSQQFYREQQQRIEVPVEPIMPVASQIVAGDLPSIDVPVEPEASKKYVPPAKKKPGGNRGL